MHIYIHIHTHTHRVPDLQLYLVVVYVDQAGPELHSDGEVVHGLEALVGELQQQATLAYVYGIQGDRGGVRREGGGQWGQGAEQWGEREIQR
jgi:hypothetical protein